MDSSGINHHDYDDLGLDNLLTCSTRLLNDDDDDDDERYVPESLASFVHAFDAALEEAKQNFFETIASPRPAIEEEDWNRTPLPNPANQITVSAAKRELQIFTIPRPVDPPSVTTSTPFKTTHNSMGDVMSTISPIVASPQGTPARQKLFKSPNLAGDQAMKQDSSEAIASKGSSSPTWSGMSAASKRRTQFIKARKASKRATPEPSKIKEKDETTSLSAMKPSGLRSRMMKASRAKRQEEQREEENSLETKASSMDSPRVDTTCNAAVNSDVAQVSATSSLGGGVTMGDSLTSDDDDNILTHEPVTKMTPSAHVTEPTMDDSVAETAMDELRANQMVETPVVAPSGDVGDTTMVDYSDDDSTTASPVAESTPTHFNSSKQTPVLETKPTDFSSTMQTPDAETRPTDLNSTMGDSLTLDAVEPTKSPVATAAPSGTVLDVRVDDSLLSDDVTTTQSSAATRTPSEQAESTPKDQASTIGSITASVLTTKRPPSDKAQTSTRVGSSTITNAVTQTPVAKRISPEKVVSGAKGSSPSIARMTQAPVAKRSPPRKATASTKVHSTTSDTSMTQLPVAKRAPSVNVGRSVRVESRDKENRNTTVSNRIKKPTLDEKIAAARERARLRSLEKETLLAEKIASKSKPSKIVSVQPVENERLRRFAMKVAPVSSKTRVAKPRVTIPQSPNFATNIKLGTRKPAPPTFAQVSLAQSTDVLRKNLRSQESVPQVRRAGLTIPKTPKFATNTRLKPRFITPGARAGIVTLAQSNDVLRKGLRAMTAPVSKRPNGLTIPKSPKFQTMTKRALPQSAAEKDTEIMNYYQSHPFKAAPIIKELPRGKPKVIPPRNQRRSSVSVAPSLRAGSRVPIAAHPPHASSKEDSENTQFKFQARPMPDFFRHSTSILKATNKKPQTQPIPFRLSPSLTSPGKTRDRSGEVSETKFRARPLPKSTYEYQPPPKTPPRVTNDAKAPDLATAKRTIKHDAVIQLSRARAEALSAEKVELQEARKREQHTKALKKSEFASHRIIPNIDNIKPFELQSTKRHELYLKQREEKKRREEEERLKHMEFHARSFHPSPAPSPIQSPRTPTQPEPFNISGMGSVEAEKAAAREKLRRKVEERKSKEQKLPFKARPVPSSTYTSPSSLASRTSPQVSFRACRTPTRASPAQSSYCNDSPSDLSDSRDVNDDEIEIEFTESDARDTEIDHFFTNLMNAESRR
ncbi:hypothetical protein FisN_22Lh066 [Fistulifera solaris]|uniref:Uncharacterized protein n=1 Tax=Fistulifera solaris TaxID=1519565 RepID=A0A1Z5JBX9_FISSO|nr:hypothetical protein FisN_22Lh066 [Fistulifera solaris]|eukprot:GAX11392.1 hypothetical protein FisN_22Lh066 [Fistulifera solaris]